MLRNPGRAEVFADSARLATALAAFFADAARSAIAERGAFYVALAGGATPRAAYEVLARHMRGLIDWKDVFVYFGDERCVLPTDPLSNYLMAETTLLGRVPLPPHNVHRMRGEDPPPQAAREYAEILRADRCPSPQLDLVMLGIGQEDRKSTRLNSSHITRSRMPSSA